MKKNCYLVSYNGLSNAGGVEKVCFYLNDIMAKKGYNVIVIDKELIQNYSLGKLYAKVFGKIHMVAFTFLASLYVKNHKRKNDILIAHGFNAPFFKIDYLFLHGTMKGFSIKTNAPINSKNKVLFYLEKKAVLNAEKILAVSQNAIDEVKKYYTNITKNYYVVNNGVDTSVFYPTNENRKEITILYCGRLDEGKGLADLLQLAKDIENKEGYIFCIACNNPNNMNLFEGLSKTEINVGVTINNINEFYNSGDVLFFPSHYEGFEMVTLEALSAGIPVLGNNVGAVSELVRKKEPGVELIDKSDLFAQINRIVKEFQDKKEFLHSYYSEKYCLDAYTEKLNKIIK